MVQKPQGTHFDISAAGAVDCVRLCDEFCSMGQVVETSKIQSSRTGTHAICFTKAPHKRQLNRAEHKPSALHIKHAKFGPILAPAAF